MGEHAYERWSRFASSRWGEGLVFAWAVAEATFWPVAPEAVLVPVVVGHERGLLRPLAASVAGTALGGSATYLFACAFPRSAWETVSGLPLVKPSWFGRARERLERSWLRGLAYQPWSGIPFKVWAVEAGPMGLKPRLVIPAFVASRGLRLAAVALVARALPALAPGFVRRRFLPLSLTYAALFLAGRLRVTR